MVIGLGDANCAANSLHKCVGFYLASHICLLSRPASTGPAPLVAQGQMVVAQGQMAGGPPPYAVRHARSTITGEDIGGRPHLPGQVLASLCLGSLAHLFFRLPDRTAQPLDCLVGLDRGRLHCLALGLELLQ